MPTPSSLRQIALIAAADFKLTLKERSTILWIFAMPLVFMVFFGLTFRGGGGGQAKAGLMIENADTGFVSRALVAELRKEPLEIVDSLKAGEKAVRTLVIPADFSEKVLARRRVVLTVRTGEDANIEASGAVTGALYRDLIKVVADLIQIESGRLGASGGAIKLVDGKIEGSLLALSRAKPGAIDSIRIALDSLRAAPPLVTMRSSTVGRARKVPSGFELSLPGNLVMFVLMSMAFSGIGITVERKEGLLRRFAYTPVGRREVVLGKLIGRMDIAFVQILFLLAVGRFVFRVPLGGSPGALILLMTALAFCAGSFGVLFGSIFGSPEQVSALSVISTLTMSALGGCWWPIEVVSRPFRIVALFFPTGWAMDGLHKLISFGYGLREVSLDVAVLAAFGLVFILIASKKLTWD
jgi:ABC-type multidrug transport system permease subunit